MGGVIGLHRMVPDDSSVTLRQVLVMKSTLFDIFTACGGVSPKRYVHEMHFTARPAVRIVNVLL